MTYFEGNKAKSVDFIRVEKNSCCGGNVKCSPRRFVLEMDGQICSKTIRMSRLLVLKDSGV